jgi:hypothetical protein
MLKKSYSAPMLRSENVELGVFGSYGQQPTTYQKPMKKKRMWFWSWWW